DRNRLNARARAHAALVGLSAFATSADLALALSIAALTVTALRSGRRPHRVRSWLVFAAASLALLAHTIFDALGSAVFGNAAALRPSSRSRQRYARTCACATSPAATAGTSS